MFKLVAPDGAVLPAMVDAADRTIRVRPEKALPDGTTILSWRVVSTDGHPVGGALAFSVRVRSKNNSRVQNAQDFPLRIAIWLSRVAVYCGVLFGVGGFTVSPRVNAAGHVLIPRGAAEALVIS